MSTNLQHFGVLGMHWGIHKRGPASADSSKVKEIKKKHVSELSNDELKAAVNRMQLEKQFKELSSASVGKGRGIVSKILLGVGAKLVNDYVSSRNPDSSSYQFFADAVRQKAGTKKG
jgi:hypothetical protein